MRRPTSDRWRRANIADAIVNHVFGTMLFVGGEPTIGEGRMIQCEELVQESRVANDQRRSSIDDARVKLGHDVILIELSVARRRPRDGHGGAPKHCGEIACLFRPVRTTADLQVNSRYVQVDRPPVVRVCARCSIPCPRSPLDGWKDNARFVATNDHTAAGRGMRRHVGATRENAGCHEKRGEPSARVVSSVSRRTGAAPSHSQAGGFACTQALAAIRSDTP